MVKFESDRALAFLDRDLQPVEREEDAEIIRELRLDGSTRWHIVQVVLPTKAVTLDAATLRAAQRRGVVYVEKYSEDQPRDEGGRWTSGGGGGGESISGGGPGGGASIPSSPDHLRSSLPASVPASSIPRAQTLSPKLREIETRFAEELAADPRGAWERYQQFSDTRDGKILSADTAKNLSADFVADGSMAAAVHEPASWFIKQAYAERLKQPPGEGEDAQVLFLAGGTGAGKTTGIQRADPEALGRAQIVYDSNLSGLDGARNKIEAALGAGKTVSVTYVDRDPVAAFTAGVFPDGPEGRGVLTRAKDTGRTMPIETHIKTHAESRQTVPLLEREYSGNDKVQFTYINNNLGASGTAKKVSGFDALPTPRYNSLRSELYDALERAHREGRISERVYRGTLNAPEEDLAQD